MKKLALITLIIIGYAANGWSADSLLDKIIFASVDKANELLTQEDDFTKCWSKFDIDARMQKQNSTKEELFDFITHQTKEWTLDEKNKIQSIFENLDELIKKQGFKIKYPSEIYFIKTTANEEGGAGGYTRASYIVLKEDLLAQSDDALKQIIVHELFHVLTRANPNFRKKMYKIIGFRLMKPIDYPENLKPYRITNPDATQTDSYIQLKVNGKPVDCMMILYAKKEYTNGSFFQYLNVGFLRLKGRKEKSIQFVDGKPVIYTFEDVSGFFEQVGKNTNYIIHPEEILADNFAYTMLGRTGLPDTDILDIIKKTLTK